FPHRPHLVVTAEEFPTQVAVMVDDPDAPGGKRLTFDGLSEKIMKAFARKMNFTAEVLHPTLLYAHDHVLHLSVTPDDLHDALHLLLTRRMIQKVQNTVGAELRKNRGASFCKICSVFLTHHKKIQPLLKLQLLEELKNMNFIVPIAALSLRIPPSKPSC
ncbi:hypothetical protein Pcinc_027306, partial [Petrolisthes cinctipes]